LILWLLVLVALVMAVAIYGEAMEVEKLMKLRKDDRAELLKKMEESSHMDQDIKALQGNLKKVLQMVEKLRKAVKSTQDELDEAEVREKDERTMRMALETKNESLKDEVRDLIEKLIAAKKKEQAARRELAVRSAEQET
jgi:chromosome segregation ATPase